MSSRWRCSTTVFWAGSAPPPLPAAPNVLGDGRSGGRGNGCARAAAAEALPAGAWAGMREEHVCLASPS